MEFVKPKIELYRVRTFSEKISDTFDFLRETWRPMLKYFLYLMLPVSIVLAFFVNHFMGSYLSMVSAMSGGSSDMQEAVAMGLMMLGAGVVMCVAAVLMTALIFSMVRLYQWRDDRLRGLTFDELKPELKHCAGRAVRLLLASLLMGVLLGLLLALVIGVLTVISPLLSVAGIIVLYVALVVVMLPLTLVVPVYMLEDDITFVEALQKAWRLGFATWGGIFAVSFVLGLVISALQTLTFMPWYVMVVLKSVFTLQGEGGGFMATGGYSLLQYLSAVWMCLGYSLMSIISTVGLTIQYGHASDKIDGTGVAQKIVKFDELDNF